MPLYEYTCEKCGYRFEVIQKFDDEPLKVCPKCGGPLKKILSPPAIHFKGSGWYVTDYKGKDNGTKHSPKNKTKDSPPKTKPQNPT